MKALIFLWSLCFLSISVVADANSQTHQDTFKVIVKWQNTKPQGRIEVLNGKLENIAIIKGKGKASNQYYYYTTSQSNTLKITIKQSVNNSGSNPTLISVINGNQSFSFFLRDVSFDYPIFMPEYQVMVCCDHDDRSFEQVANEIRNRNLKTKLQQIDDEPEESFESAAKHTRNQKCPVWLGISRDIRIFELGVPEGEMDIISPKLAANSVYLAETNNTSVEYCYMTGRGQGVEQRVKRRLDEGVLPVVHTEIIDEDIKYHNIAFVTNEFSPLNTETLKGTDFLVADFFSSGHMFTPEQENLLNPLLLTESKKTEETVLYFRSEATNLSKVPRYACFRTLRPGSGWWEKFPYIYTKENGYSCYSPNRVFALSKLNGAPLPNEEIAVLLKPNETAIFEFRLPHKPVSMERATIISQQSFTRKLAECKAFWLNKLSQAALIKLPEKRIEEMIQAGLNHLDLITYGIEPMGTLAPCIGIYSPIGTESAPIIQFYCSMSLHEMAKRSLMYFLDKQHDDGLIQNFGGYMVETGAVLWGIGEYFRYTRDTAWIIQMKPKLLKSCEYLRNWREHNKTENLRGKGFGMIDGKVADPEDPYHQYMLNAYAYLGMSRMAEILNDIDSENSSKLRLEAENWKKDIRASIMYSISHSPVIPMGDGTWSPTLPPWTESQAPRMLYFTDETYMSHGTFTIPDALLGPLHLIFCEVLDINEPLSKMLLNYHSELLYQRNTAFSQPYYSRHDWVQLKMNLVKPFLKTYYSSLSSLADRETYTFWEHLYQASVHKTHEEAWFLMATRWMLYLEEGSSLRLLTGIPRKWMEDGKTIELKNVYSYFGPLSLLVNSYLNQGFIEATFECISERMPEQVILRIPHPEGKSAKHVTGGVYDNVTESVLISPFKGKTIIKIEY